jgi:hypothetical protein
MIGILRVFPSKIGDFSLDDAVYIAGIFAVACSAYPQICDTWETSLIYKALRDTGTLGTVTDVNGKPLVSATIPTKQRPYAFWGLPALAFALHGWAARDGWYISRNHEHGCGFDGESFMSRVRRIRWVRQHRVYDGRGEVART